MEDYTNKKEDAAAEGVKLDNNATIAAEEARKTLGLRFRVVASELSYKIKSMVTVFGDIIPWVR